MIYIIAFLIGLSLIPIFNKEKEDDKTEDSLSELLKYI